MLTYQMTNVFGFDNLLIAKLPEVVRANAGGAQDTWDCSLDACSCSLDAYDCRLGAWVAAWVQGCSW